MTVYLSVPAIAKQYGVHRGTVRRWIQVGCCGLRLEATRIGGHWKTTQACLDAFFEACTAAKLPPSEFPLPPRASAQELANRYESSLKRLRAKGYQV